jgi:hypothetical protein
MHEVKTIGELFATSCKESDGVGAKAEESTPDIWSIFQVGV